MLKKKGKTEIVTLDVTEIKKIELQLMKKIHDFCEEKGIKYYLWGGTLLGAVRHDGFIPWDDDIDIIMPREDYKIFVESFNTENAGVFSCETNDLHPFPYAKVFDKNTIKKEEIRYDGDYCIGVDVDIFMLDFVENIDEMLKSCKKRKRLLEEIKLSKRKYNAAGTWIKRMLLNSYLLLLSPYLLIFRKKTNDVCRKLNDMAQKYAGGSTENVMLYADANIKMPLFMNGELFANRSLHKFEEYEFYIPDGYHEVLTKCYGDYMTLPPEEKRITHHNYKVYQKEA